MHSHRQLDIFLMKSSLPRSSSRLTAVARSHRLRLFTRSLRTRWRLGVGAAASSRWAFWVPHTRRRVLVTSAGRSPFIRCASFTGNAHSRATSRIVCHNSRAFHPACASLSGFSRSSVPVLGGFVTFYLFCAIASFPGVGIAARTSAFTARTSALAARTSESPGFMFRRRAPKHPLYPEFLRRPHPPTKTPSHGFYRVFGWFGFGWLEKFKFGTLYHYLASGFNPVFSKIDICGKRKLQTI